MLRVYRVPVGRRIRRVARPIDRVVMGFVMGVIVFAIERVVVRSTRHGAKRASSE
jgi:hypothetical protein